MISGVPSANTRSVLCHVPPRTPSQLHNWVRSVLGFDIPRVPLIAGHAAPFDYLCHAFFEDARAASQRNALVWAARGAGKTQIGAIATLLDLLFKPGIEICILGGSFAQSSRMHMHLRRMLQDEALIGLVDGRITLDHVQLINGSRVEVLSQSQTAVRGRRVHRLRCDEVELFEPEVWEAAQLITRSGRCGDIEVRAGVEALSTMHKPFGMMSRLLGNASDAGMRVFKWSVIDVLERCSPSRACDDCNLFAAGCEGRAKRVECRGFFHIDDALDQHSRIPPHAWSSEMLCAKPDVSDCVYPEFDETVHVFDDATAPANDASIVWLGGMDFGFHAPTVLLLAMLDGANVLHVMEEIVERSCTTARMIELARQRMNQVRGMCSGFRQNPNNGVLNIPPSHSQGRNRCEYPSSGMRLEWIGADPAGLQRSDQTGISTIAHWRRAGFVIRTLPTTVEAGIETVRAASLRSADGSIGLRIHRRCRQLIRARARISLRSQAPCETPVKDGPDHAADALRYLIVNLDGPGGEVRVRGY